MTLNVIPSNLCKSNYASIGVTELANGILEESMICAGYVNGEKDTCGVSYITSCFVFDIME